MILKLSDTQRFFESKGVDAGFCRICGSRQIKIYGDVIESDTDKIDANISVIMSNVLDSNASLKEINTSIKLYCVNCGYEFAFNAEVIDLWIKNNSEL